MKYLLLAYGDRKKSGEARASYERALALTRQGPERRFMEGRLRELRSSGDV